MPQGKYSFIHKVIDGITVVVNTVNVKFKSPAFTASIQVNDFEITLLEKEVSNFNFLDVSYSC